MPTLIELPTTFAPVPHTLLMDTSVSASAVRLYGVLHYMGWERLPVEIDTLAEKLKAVDRSVYRWLYELERAGWIVYQRTPGQRGLGSKIRLLDRASPSADPGPPPPDDPDDLDDPLTPRSDDTRVSGTDTTIRGSDTRVSAADRGIIAADSGVRTTPVLGLPNAVKNATQNPERIRKDHGGGGEARVTKKRERTATETWLVEQGMHPTTARQFSDLPADIAQADFAARLGDGQSIGVIVAAWRQVQPAAGATYSPARKKETPNAANQPQRPARTLGRREYNPTPLPEGERDRSKLPTVADLRAAGLL